MTHDVGGPLKVVPFVRPGARGRNHDAGVTKENVEGRFLAG